MTQTQNPKLLYAIDQSWSNDYAIGIKGWIFHTEQPLKQVAISAGDSSVPITSWHSRPDVVAAYPQYKYTENCGFWVQIPRIAEHEIAFKAQHQEGLENIRANFTGTQPTFPNEFPKSGKSFDQFIQLVNENHLKVIEIGSRIVAPGSSSKRELFPDAASYTGFDYYPDENTDVVGDAHRLSQYFANQRFDAIFSISVFEHLAMPWVVAMEINKLLEIGGITFHHTHFAWPMHDRPWDFWRFSEAGLKVLFSPPMGFEVMKAGFYEPLRMHFDRLVPGQEQFPLFPSFGGVSILAKKVAEVHPTQFNWDVSIEEVLGTSSHYPKDEKPGLSG
jgi:hypothetical protein